MSGNLFVPSLDFFFLFFFNAAVAHLSHLVVLKSDIIEFKTSWGN